MIAFRAVTSLSRVQQRYLVFFFKPKNGKQMHEADFCKHLGDYKVLIITIDYWYRQFHGIIPRRHKGVNFRSTPKIFAASIMANISIDASMPYYCYCPLPFSRMVLESHTHTSLISVGDTIHHSIILQSNYWLAKSTPF
jgi:hypothetical protein